MQPQALFGALWAAAFVLSAASARAQSTPGSAVVLNGTWRAGATSTEVAIESWGADCGPRPQSIHSTGGGLVKIEQDKQVLLLHARDQDIRSDGCWSRNPSMRRQMASYSNGFWLTRCKTPDNDPRAEQGTYMLKLLNPDTLQYQDISHFDWALNTSKCVATFTTTQALTRATGAKAEPVSPPTAATTNPTTGNPVPQRVEAPTVEVPPAPPDPEDSACTPGTPTRISLRPRHVDLEVGQRICFRARVSDAKDCPIRDARLDWSLAHTKALRGTLVGGCFTAADSAAEAQGEFKIVASADKLQAEAVVVVRPIDLSALIAKRMEGGALTGFDESAAAPATPPKAVARIATRTEAAASGSRRSLMLGLGALAVGLTVVGWWLSRRPRPAADRPRSRDSFITEASARTDASSTDASTSATTATVASAASSAPPAEGVEPWICPTCRVGYPAAQGACPKDGAPLMRYADFAQRGREAEGHKKRCPKCGETFPASAGFCGSDGSNLVDL